MKIELQTELSPDRARIEKYFRQADTCFEPKLSDQTDISAYAEKIAQYGCAIWCVCEEEDVGLCAFYANRPPEAFLTSLSVLKPFQGQGLARRMLRELKRLCIRRNLDTITLEVYRTNDRAQQLYQKEKFCISLYSGEKYTMTTKVEGAKNYGEGFSSADQL